MPVCKLMHSHREGLEVHVITIFSNLSDNTLWLRHLSHIYVLAHLSWPCIRDKPTFLLLHYKFISGLGSPAL